MRRVSPMAASLPLCWACWCYEAQATTLSPLPPAPLLSKRCAGEPNKVPEQLYPTVTLGLSSTPIIFQTSRTPSATELPTGHGLWVPTA